MPVSRRYDLDWLRIIAFALLILYHVGMFYVTWDWHVKSRAASAAIEPLMMLVNPWRLTLLFLISGAATRFMADKMSVWRFASARMGRLWPPLLLAVFVVVPPQSYYQLVEALQTMGQPQSPALDNFYIKYVTASGHWCREGDCLTTPTYNHMWFVAYLIIYTLVLLPLLPLLRRLPKTAAALISGPWLFVTPWLFLFASRAVLFPTFGETHDFRSDWYLHATYFATFLFGFAIAKHGPFFERCARWRWLGLVMALASWAAIMGAYSVYNETNMPPDWLRQVFRGILELQAWAAIVAAIGFAHRHLREADGPLRRLLTQAIFPFYLVHQTIIVVAAYNLDRLEMPLWIEAPALIGITVLGCWLFFDLGRRLAPLRVWIGLPSKIREMPVSIQPSATGEAR
ncbi:MAG: acyltransferase [Hyphomonadaceae bacterium]